MPGLRVHTPPREELTPFHQAVLDAAADAGYPFIRDLSSLDPEFGFAIGPVNIDPATKVRWNAAFAYLDPLRDLPNLRIVPDTLADKLDARRDASHRIGRRRTSGLIPYRRRQGDPRRGRVRLAADSAPLRDRRGGRAARAGNRAAAMTCRGSAATCRTTRRSGFTIRAGRRRSPRWRRSSPPAGCHGKRAPSGSLAPAAARDRTICTSTPSPRARSAARAGASTSRRR